MTINPVKTHPLTIWLNKQNSLVKTIYIASIAFLTYACMYGLRKPFMVAEFEGLRLWGMDFKSILIISQVAGYALSKFMGIRIISEMRRSRRAFSIVFLTGFAEAALVLFGIVPSPWNILMLFINGVPLGMIWGLVFSYLEGRKTTEFLGSVLSVSFIVSSGFVKSIGKSLMMHLSISEFQMPWITGLVFYIPMLLLVWLLDKSPEPGKEDETLRTKRVPMDRNMRYSIFSRYAPGLILLIASYVLLTIFRDLRDNFAAEIWQSIGVTGNSMIFTYSELPVALIVMAIMSLLMLVKNNNKALQMNHYIIMAGFLLTGFSTLLLSAGIISPTAWMILLGLGTYMGYLPFNCILFDRLVAAGGTAANAGFFIYVADSFGYLGSVSILLFKNFSNYNTSWFNFLINSSMNLALTGIILVTASAIYFRRKFSTGINKTVSAPAV